jgi:hypothetical protein
MRPVACVLHRWAVAALGAALSPMLRMKSTFKVAPRRALRSQRGGVGVEHVVVLIGVAAVGLTGFGTIGRGMSSGIAGESHGATTHQPGAFAMWQGPAAHAPDSRNAPLSAQGGIGGVLANLASAADSGRILDEALPLADDLDVLSDAQGWPQRAVMPADPKERSAAIHRGVDRIAPTAPPGARAHYASVLAGSTRPDPLDAMSRKAELEAADALKRGDRFTYALRTRGRAVGHERGFAVPLDELSGALDTWRRVKDWDEESTTIRGLMDNNLAFLSDYLERLIPFYEGAWSPWKGSGRGGADADLAAEVALRSMKRVLERTKEVAARETLSKRQSWSLFDEFFDAEAALVGRQSSSSFKRSNYAMSETDVFPLVSETQRYWSFDHVHEWTAARTYPLEISLSDKPFDGTLAYAGAYAGHDMVHIEFLDDSGAAPWLRYGAWNGEHELRPALTAHIQSRLEQLKATNPEEAAQIQRALNYVTWEDAQSVNALARNDSGASESARGRLARWLAEFETAQGSDVFFGHDAEALANLIPGYQRPDAPRR